MEIIKDSNKNRFTVVQARNIYIGCVLILMGVLWMINNYNIIPYPFSSILFSWQFFIILLGGYFITVRNVTVGLILCTLGFVMMLPEFFNIRLRWSKVILPMVLVVGGISVLASARRKNRKK